MKSLVTKDIFCRFKCIETKKQADSISKCWKKLNFVIVSLQTLKLLCFAPAVLTLYSPNAQICNASHLSVSMVNETGFGATVTSTSLLCFGLKPCYCNFGKIR